MALNTDVHRSFLVRILKDIYSSVALGPLLGFKGGTAAYLFHKLSRFSVDLDFDLLDSAQEEFVFQEVRQILQAYGMVKDARQKRYSLFYLLSYQGKQLDSQNIKVEIDRRDFGSSYEIRNYLGIAVKVMSPPDMAAHKLVAMSERLGKSNRDIFDLWFFLQNNWSINSVIVERRTGVAYREYLYQCIELLEGYSSRNILSGMGELLDPQQKIWVKSKLKSELIFLLKVILDGIDTKLGEANQQK